MSLFALAAWIMTAGGGLYLLSIWLIEYDKDFHAVTATRLPPAVLASHVLLAGSGLVLWAVYLVFDDDEVADISLAVIVIAASLGVVMAIRWIGVYRAGRTRARSVVPAGDGRVAVLERPAREGPPERNFPLPVVIAHGAFAAATITLVTISVYR
jgi:manganese efflux pump family protein